MDAMADRQDSDREVLTSLPRSRPVRRSAKRGARPDAAGAAAPAATSATAGAPRARKPRAPAQPKATANGAAKATARAPRPPRVAAVREDGAATAPRPRRTIPPAGYAAPTSHAGEDHRSASADLIGTAVQAAGELAQIGFAVGRQTLQSMIDRLPKP
jgi:hypothetical protein